MQKPSDGLLQALAVTLAAIGSEMSQATADVIAAELAAYPESQVLPALARCKTECKYRLSLADVIERIDDGHPGPEEAWQLVPKSEADTAVLTQEIMAAIPFTLIDVGDLTAARMAFREAYTRLRAESKAARRPPRWFASIGHDKRGREAPLLRAVELGRLGHEQVAALLPPPEDRAGSNVALIAKLRGKP